MVPAGRVLVLLSAAVLALAGCARSSSICEGCGRVEHDHMNVALARDDGTRQHACCPRCAVRLAASGPAVISVTVHDFYTGEAIDAERAVFVESADVHVCEGRLARPPRDADGVALTRAYDRCEPSVVALATREVAERFAREHGGTLTSWSQLAIEEGARIERQGAP